MKKILAMVVMAGTLLTLSSQTWAKADYEGKEKGWHKGIYILVGGGFMNVDEDTNVVNSQAFGSDNIPSYGFTIGHNFLDFLALELSTRYGAEKIGTRREHAANIDLNVKYSFILDALTRMKSARFLPYVKLGGGAFGATLPDTSAGNDRFGVWGPSMALGGGMEILLAKYFYAGVDFTSNLVWLQEKTNNSGKKILNGGFDPQYSAFGYLGIHF